MSEAFTFTYCFFFQEFSNYLKSIFQKGLEKKYSNLENFYDSPFPRTSQNAPNII